MERRAVDGARERRQPHGGALPLRRPARPLGEGAGHLHRHRPGGRHPVRPRRALVAARQRERARRRQARRAARLPRRNAAGPVAAPRGQPGGGRRALCPPGGAGVHARGPAAAPGPGVRARIRPRIEPAVHRSLDAQRIRRAHRGPHRPGLAAGHRLRAHPQPPAGPDGLRFPGPPAALCALASPQSAPLTAAGNDEGTPA
jgi:hypothetical protein